MSVTTRVLSYWAMEFVKDEKFYFDKNMFVDFLKYIDTFDSKKRIEKLENENKIYMIDKLSVNKSIDIEYVKLVFKWCKYNHSPNYMSSNDGSERPSEKKLFEGEKEINHICMRIDEQEAYIVIEERRGGVSGTHLYGYLNGFFEEYLKSIGEKEQIELSISRVPSEDFLTQLKNCSRISMAEIFLEKKVLGSEYLQLTDETELISENVILTVKSERNESIAKKFVRNLYEKLVGNDSEISRIRLRIKNSDNTDIKIDSLNAGKKKSLKVNLQENGVVDTGDIFKKMEKIIGVINDK